MWWRFLARWQVQEAEGAGTRDYYSQSTQPPIPKEGGCNSEGKHLPNIHRLLGSIPSTPQTRHGEGSTPVISAFSGSGGRGIKFKIIHSHTKNLRPAWATRDPAFKQNKGPPKSDLLLKPGLAAYEIHSFQNGSMSLRPSIQNTSLRRTF